MPLILLLFVSLLWGSSFILVETASLSFDPLSIALIRAFVASTCMIFWAAVMRSRWPTSLCIWREVLSLSILGQVLPLIGLSFAASRLTSGHVAILVGSAPLLTFLMARCIGSNEVWNKLTAAGLVAGFLGLWLSLRSTNGGDPIAGWVGNVCALLAALGYGAGALISKSTSAKIGSVMTVTTSLSLTTGILGIVWIIARLGHPSTISLSANGDALTSLFLLGGVNTAIAYVAYFSLINRAGAMFASVNNYLVPPIGILAGAIWLGERLNLTTLGATGLIVAGAILVALGRTRGGSYIGQKAPTR